MGRKKENNAHEHFTFKPAENVSTCKICKGEIKGKHATNLKRHLVRVHDFNETEFASPASNSKNTNPSANLMKQQCIEDVGFIKVQMSKNILIDSCVELVTVNGRPFTLMNDSGFKKIIEPLKKGLEKKTQSNEFVSITTEGIKSHISNEAATLKAKIIEELKNKMVSLKTDGVTRLQRNFLGINVQYIKDGKIILRTLALKELKESHTGDYLKKIILEVCEDFKIREEQIYTVTTDNGANMIKAVKIICTDNGEMEIAEFDPGADSDNDGETSEDFNENDSDNEETEGTMDCGDGRDASFLNDDITFTLFSMNNTPHNGDELNYSNFLKATGMRCAAHTLQLAIEDAFKKDKSICSLISHGRKIATKLRTSTFSYMLKKQNLKKPTLDCTTRWCSTLTMLESLLPLQEFCREMCVTGFKKFKNLKQAQWLSLKNLCLVLAPTKICTKKLQYEQLTLSDIFGYWKECKMAIEKMSTPFAETLIVYMNARETILFDENDVMLSAVFLDPRYKILLTSEQIERAKSHLKKLWVRLMKLKIKENEELNNIDDDDDTDGSSETLSSPSASDEFEQLLRSKEKEKNVYRTMFKSPENQTAVMSRKIDSLLNSYDAEQERIDRKQKILKFWESNKHVYPELYVLAETVFAVPGTQVSVERLFSGLKFILSPQRANVKEKHLEEQLFIRTNRIFEKKESKLDKTTEPFAVVERVAEKRKTGEEKETDEGEVQCVEEVEKEKGSAQPSIKKFFFAKDKK